jgi:hypothetical protein
MEPEVAFNICMFCAAAVVYLWLWYCAITHAGEKRFSITATVVIGLMFSPLIAFIVVALLANPAESADRGWNSDAQEEAEPQ